MAGSIVGIDLGTTFSAMARLDERGQPATIPNRDGEMLTPSAVYLLGNSAVVGQAALDVSRESPFSVATLIKRRMGHPDFSYPVDGRHFRPETLSAIILRKLLVDAENRIGPIAQAVITVPAYFDDTRRKATQDAGRIAGLEVLDILDEPTAAALCWSFQNSPVSDSLQLTDKPRNILVYDLGGGTFDVTIVRMLPKRFQSLAIEGDVRLGGRDFDDRIVGYVSEQFLKKFGSDPRTDPQSLATLQASAERVKRSLSRLEQVNLSCDHDGNRLTLPITREQFEQITGDLILRTKLTTKQALKAAGLTWDQIDRILLVGGSTHMPMTGRMMRELSGRPVENSLAVSEIVARGAAIHGGILAARSAEGRRTLTEVSRKNLEGVVEISVNAHGLGVRVRGETEKLNDILIPKNTQLPAAASRVYRTVSDNQGRVKVVVLQGDAHQAEACISVGECWVEDLPHDLPRGSPIQVRCSLSANGLIEVMALDMTSGQMARTTILRKSGLNSEEIQRERNLLQTLNIS